MGEPINLEKLAESQGISSEGLNGNQIALAMNEWMRRYIEDPEKFEREFQSIDLFLKQEAIHAEPSYGDTCSAYMMKLHKELQDD